MRPPDWRAGALPTELTSPILGVSSRKSFNHYGILPFSQGSRPSYGASPYCRFPCCTVTWAWSLAKGKYTVDSWLLTGAPEQRYWQNRETANIGLVSSVGRAPARQSGGRRFKSRSFNFFFVHPKIFQKMYPVRFPCGLLHDKYPFC